MSGVRALSEWEADELAAHARCGWTLHELARFYGVSERTVQRYLRRAGADALRADSRPAVRENE